MKRTVAIVLLAVHLFTTGGYSLLFEYFIHQSDKDMVRIFYDQKTNTKLLEIKVPVHMPDVQPWTQYEHIEGQIQLKENCYNYVRLKITRDTMYMIGLPNTVKTQLIKANVILAKQINDAPVNKKGHDSVKKGNDVQYHFQALNYQFAATALIVKKNYDNEYSTLLNPFIETRGQPPDFGC